MPSPRESPSRDEPRVPRGALESTEMAKNGRALIAHLMRRAGFGATRSELEALVARDYEAVVDDLLNPERFPDIEADIEAVAAMATDALLVPKVDDAATVVEVARRMEAAGAPETMAIWCLIETARGVLNAAAIVAASPRLGAFLVGAADLSKDLRALHTPDRMPLLVSIGMCILAARANRLAVLDSPFFDISDDAGFARSCRQGRELGFDGKTLIHPRTIDGANAAFGPSPDEIAWARRIIAAYDKAAAEGKGVTVVDDQLIEGLHVAEARDLIALSEAIAEMDQA